MCFVGAFHTLHWTPALIQIFILDRLQLLGGRGHFFLLKIMTILHDVAQVWTVIVLQCIAFYKLIQLLDLLAEDALHAQCWHVPRLLMQQFHVLLYFSISADLTMNAVGARTFLTDVLRGLLNHRTNDASFLFAHLREDHWRLSFGVWTLILPLVYRILTLRVKIKCNRTFNIVTRLFTQLGYRVSLSRQLDRYGPTGREARADLSLLVTYNCSPISHRRGAHCIVHEVHQCFHLRISIFVRCIGRWRQWRSNAIQALHLVLFRRYVRDIWTQDYRHVKLDRFFRLLSPLQLTLHSAFDFLVVVQAIISFGRVLQTWRCLTYALVEPLRQLKFWVCLCRRFLR